MRVSLFVSLGLTPLACGGTAISPSDGSAGASAQAGAGAQGGGSYAGGSYAGGTSYGGYGGYGGYPNGGGSYGGGCGGCPVIVIAGAGGYTAPSCDSPVFDPLTHLTKCADGLEHRPAAVACSYNSIPGGGGAGGIGGCKSDADCTALPFGYCDSEPPMQAQCRASCQTDGDCAAFELCECAGPGAPGKCLIAGCRVDADCGPNSLCAPVKQLCSDHEFVCTSVKDACTTDADCSAPAYCSSISGVYRSCSDAVCPLR